MLKSPPLHPKLLHLFPTLPAAAAALPITCTRRRRRRQKPFTFPSPSLPRFVSSSFRRLLPRLLLGGGGGGGAGRGSGGSRIVGGGGGGGWFGRSWRRRGWAEELLALALSLALGDGHGILAASWKSSRLSQVMGFWMALAKKRGRKRGFGRVAAFLVGFAFCFFIYCLQIL